MWELVIGMHFRLLSPAEGGLWHPGACGSASLKSLPASGCDVSVPRHVRHPDGRVEPARVASGACVVLQMWVPERECVDG